MGLRTGEVGLVWIGETRDPRGPIDLLRAGCPGRKRATLDRSTPIIGQATPRVSIDKAYRRLQCDRCCCRRRRRRRRRCRCRCMAPVAHPRGGGSAQSTAHHHHRSNQPKTGPTPCTASNKGAFGPLEPRWGTTEGPNSAGSAPVPAAAPWYVCIASAAAACSSSCSPRCSH